MKRLALLLASIATVPLAACEIGSVDPPPNAYAPYGPPGAPYAAPGLNPGTGSEVDYWRRAAASQPYNSRITLQFARALIDANQDDEARSVLENAQANFIQDREIALELGRILFSLHEYRRALSIVERFYGEPSPDLRILNLHGQILDATGQHTLAQDLYRKALSIAPNHLATRNNLAISQGLSNHPMSAVDTLYPALNAPESDHRIRTNLALLLAISGRVDEAVSVVAHDYSKRVAEANLLAIANAAQATSPASALRDALGLKQFSYADDPVKRAEVGDIVSTPEGTGIVRQRVDSGADSTAPLLRGQTGAFASGWVEDHADYDGVPQVGGRPASTNPNGF